MINSFNYRYILVFLGIFLFTISSFGQVQSDCANAVAVCSNAGSNGTVGGAGIDDFGGATNSGCLGGGGGGSGIESNSAWYTFTLAVDGQFGFDISPSNLGEDWDFGLYGPFVDTTGNCSSLGNPDAACNYAANPGHTGVGVNPATGTQTAAYNPWVNGLAGETYILMINNFSNSPTGFVLTFTGDIFDAHTPPLDCSVVASIDYCVGDNINLDATTPNATSYIWDEVGTVLSETGPILSGILATTTQYHVQAFNSSGVLVGEQTFNVSVSTPNAGTAIAIADICEGDTINLYDLGLTTDADTGGTWTDDEGSGGVITGNSFDATGVAADTYDFTYTVTLGSCPPDIETIEVTVLSSPATPIITVVAPTCSTTGTATMTNPVAGNTYTSTPAGLT
ncbi:MAG: hypothetical protein COA67_09175, partial [Lutibacter sp.]